MKLSKEFPPELRAIIERGLSQGALEGVVFLTLDEAKALLRRIPEFKENGDWQLPIETLKQRIEQVEATNTQEEIKRLEKEIARLKADQARDNRAKEQFLKRMEDKDV